MHISQNLPLRVCACVWGHPCVRLVAGACAALHQTNAEVTNLSTQSHIFAGCIVCRGKGTPANRNGTANRATRLYGGGKGIRGENAQKTSEIKNQYKALALHRFPLGRGGRPKLMMNVSESGGTVRKQQRIQYSIQSFINILSSSSPSARLFFLLPDRTRFIGKMSPLQCGMCPPRTFPMAKSQTH